MSETEEFFFIIFSPLFLFSRPFYEGRESCGVFRQFMRENFEC